MATLKQMDKKQKEFISNLKADDLKKYIDNITKQYYIHLSLVESLVRYYDLSISTEKVQKVFSIEKYRANQKWHKLKKKEIF